MTDLNNVVNNLKQPDVYSIICELLFTLNKEPQYATLSELAYLLDKQSFINLLQYFDGQTIKIPTQQEFKKCVRLLLLFQYYKIEQKPWKDSLLMAGFESREGKSAHCQLDKLCTILDKYNFGNRTY